MATKNENPPTRHSWRLPIAAFIAGATLVFLLFLVFSSDARNNIVGVPTEIREGGYRFISPLLECEMVSNSLQGSKYNFKKTLADLVNAKVAAGSVNVIAIYYRDLTNGPWFGINSDEPFLPASLLKVPIAMTVLKMAEDDPTILSRVIRVNEPYVFPGDKAQFISPEKQVEVGKEYTVRELMELALGYSDNHANMILYNQVVDTEVLFDLFTRLGVPTDVLNNMNATISARNYATFFRILYNSSFLNRASSELLLEFLSETSFTKGLIGGVPEMTVVSHKFGEAGTTQEHQLHDCGIVYHEKYPYVACVMARGPSIEELESSIQEVSRILYTEVSKFE
jgi:beta-lactamase class A